MYGFLSDTYLKYLKEVQPLSHIQNIICFMLWYFFLFFLFLLCIGSRSAVPSSSNTSLVNPACQPVISAWFIQMTKSQHYWSQPKLINLQLVSQINPLKLVNFQPVSQVNLQSQLAYLWNRFNRFKHTTSIRFTNYQSMECPVNNQWNR